MLILKSASPRRKQILENLNLRFLIQPSHINEDLQESEDPLLYLKRVTIAKLEQETALNENMYISSDTIVVLGDQILGKPASVEDGLRILKMLSGKSHSVYSGLAIWVKDEVIYNFDETIVHFKSWGEKEILAYLETCKPFDKAGAYGIQDKESPVLKYTGSYSNVMGFPLRKFYSYYPAWKQFLGKDI